MVRPEILRKRIQSLDDYLEYLERARSTPWEEFADSPERYGSVERFLHLAIEALTDMGSHAIADENLGAVNRYRDIPDLLARHGWIDETLRNRWTRMIGFRNILVHDYLDLDRQIVYEVLQNDLEDLRRLRDVFAARL